jgi:predicted PurR-regulated permease PerM
MFLLDARAARATWTVLVFAVGIALVWLLRDVLLLSAFSLFFAYLIFPLVRVVERGLGVAPRRALAIGVVYLVLLVGLGTAAASLVPRLTREVAGLAQRLPEMSQQIESGQIVGHMLPVPGWGDERGRQLERLVRLHAPQIVGYAQQAAAGLLRWLSGAWVIVLIPVFAFFILRDAERAAGGIEALIENPAHRRLWYDIADDVNRLFGEYVRALIILSVVTFVVWSLLFFLTGVPYALVLAAIGGGLEFIPVLGPLVGGVIVVSVALFSGYPHPWLLAVFILGWRLVQDYVTSPSVMARGIELHPALVIFGVIAGGEIAGPAGMFLSVPIIAALRVVWRRLRAFRRAPPLADRHPPAAEVAQERRSPRP